MADFLSAPNRVRPPASNSAVTSEALLDEALRLLVSRQQRLDFLTICLTITYQVNFN